MGLLFGGQVEKEGDLAFVGDIFDTGEVSDDFDLTAVGFLEELIDQDLHAMADATDDLAHSGRSLAFAVTVIQLNAAFFHGVCTSLLNL